MCWGNLHAFDGLSSVNNTIVTFPIVFTQIFTIVLGQKADTTADALKTYWDISVTTIQKDRMRIWARAQNSPGYFWLVVGY